MDLINNSTYVLTPTVWQNTCKINEFEILSNLERIPKVAFWMTVAMFVFLAIQWLVIPLFINHKYYKYFEDSFLGFAFALSAFPPLMLLGYTYTLTEELVSNIETVVIIIAVLASCVWIYKNKDWIKKGIKDMEDDKNGKEKE